MKLMQSVALYNEEVTGPEHALIIGNRACRMALSERGVAHLTVSKDVQMMKLAADKRSMRNPGVRTSSSWSPPLPTPPAEQLRAAAEILNSGSRVAVLVARARCPRATRSSRSPTGLPHPWRRRSWAKQCCPMTAPLRPVASAISAPRHQLDHEELRHCADPQLDYAVGRILSLPGQSRGVQVDLKPDRLGLAIRSRSA